MPWAVLGFGFNHLQQPPEDDVVCHTPVVGLSLGMAETRIAVGLFISRGQEIAVGAGEVDVAAIAEVCGIAGLLE